MYKYSWSKNFRTFGKAEYFGWNGMPIIGKTNHATRFVAAQLSVVQDFENTLFKNALLIKTINKYAFEDFF